MEAVKQGSAAVGLRSNTHAVILALKVRIGPFWTFGDSIWSTNATHSGRLVSSLHTRRRSSESTTTWVLQLLD